MDDYTSELKLSHDALKKAMNVIVANDKELDEYTRRMSITAIVGLSNGDLIPFAKLLMSPAPILPMMVRQIFAELILDQSHLGAIVELKKSPRFPRNKHNEIDKAKRYQELWPIVKFLYENDIDKKGHYEAAILAAMKKFDVSRSKVTKAHKIFRDRFIKLGGPDLLKEYISSINEDGLTFGAQI